MNEYTVAVYSLTKAGNRVFAWASKDSGLSALSEQPAFINDALAAANFLYSLPADSAVNVLSRTNYLKEYMEGKRVADLDPELLILKHAVERLKNVTFYRIVKKHHKLEKRAKKLATYLLVHKKFGSVQETFDGKTSTVKGTLK